MANTIESNLQKVKQKIEKSARKVNRDPKEIKLVAVTKGVEISKILEVIHAGVEIIGESRIQEARLKYGEIKNQVEFHLIGHLQKNKVKEAVKMFNLIHSIDSLALAREIDKRAYQLGKVQNILIEVNVFGEKTKFGLAPSDVEELINEIKSLANLHLQGLMTITPLVNNLEEIRVYFRILKKLNDKFGLKYLSMGMSNDFEVAIEEGSNMLRIGRAIFADQITLQRHLKTDKSKVL